MFLNYYQLAEEPFGVTPDPRFLYLGVQHREALASLVHGTESNRGFLAIIAEPGMGKTSLLYRYLSDRREKGRAAFVFRSDCEPTEFIRYVLLDLGVDISGMDQPTMHEALNRILREEMEAGRRFVLVVDEAQSLQLKTLESIRLLSNFETPWMKLMVIVLAGQPEFAERLASPSLAQLRQRISMMIRISPFTEDEVNAYIDHRLWVAGGKTPALFTPAARKLIAEHSEGIARNINNICFNAMSLACALRREAIDADIVKEAVADLDLATLMERNPREIEEQSLSAESFRSRQRFAPQAAPDASEFEKHREPQISRREPAPDKNHEAGAVPEPPKQRPAYGKWVPRFVVVSALLLALGGSARELNRGELQSFETAAGVTPLAAASPSSTQTTDTPSDRATYVPGSVEKPDTGIGARLKAVNQERVQTSDQQSVDQGKQHDE